MIDVEGVREVSEYMWVVEFTVEGGLTDDDLGVLCGDHGFGVVGDVDDDSSIYSISGSTRAVSALEACAHIDDLLESAVAGRTTIMGIDILVDELWWERQGLDSRLTHEVS